MFTAKQSYMFKKRKEEFSKLKLKRKFEVLMANKSLLKKQSFLMVESIHSFYLENKRISKKQLVALVSIYTYNPKITVRGSNKTFKRLSKIEKENNRIYALKELESHAIEFIELQANNVLIDEYMRLNLSSLKWKNLRNEEKGHGMRGLLIQIGEIKPPTKEDQVLAVKSVLLKGKAGKRR